MDKDLGFISCATVCIAPVLTVASPQTLIQCLGSKKGSLYENK